MINTINIAIVDDKNINRQSLNERIQSTANLKVVLMAENGEDYINQLKSLELNQHPMITLMDIDMPIMNGIDAVKKGLELFPKTKYLMITIFEDDDKIFDSILAGASGYLLKEENSETISRSIQEIIEYGGAPMSPKIARKALNMLTKNISSKDVTETSDYDLSKRELDILKLLVGGHDYKIIADKLFISPHTARKHIANIYVKLQVSNKVDAVKIAIKKGWFGLLFTA
ncbi:MAG: response regulator transcription factor [Bacteroidota bacterium]|nr:response regulator transcription factor [Bacteroidota bacterium]